jgi:hypothetical protein
MKHNYMKPATQVIEIKHQTSLLQTSQPPVLTAPDAGNDPADWYELE